MAVVGQTDKLGVVCQKQGLISKADSFDRVIPPLPSLQRTERANKASVL